MSSIPAPNQFLIINDKTLIESELHSVDSFAGLNIDVAISSTDNNGSLSLFCVAENPTEVKDYEFRVQNSGSLQSSAYIWQEQDSSNWYGEPDRRSLYNAGTGLNTTVEAYNATGIYSSKQNKVFLYTGSSSNIIDVKYRSLDSQGSWTGSTIDISSTSDGLGADGLGTQSGVLDVCELPDGLLLMVVKYEKDLYLYSSEDGLNWSLYADKLASRFADIKSEFLSVKIASSGNYVRIIGIISRVRDSGTTYPLFSLVSADRGSTWTINNLDTEEFQATQKEGSGDDRFSIDICNFDNNGTFIVALLDSGKDKYKTYVASGTGILSYVSSLDINQSLEYKDIYLCNFSDGIYAVTVCLSSRNDLTPDITEEVPVQSVFGNQTNQTQTVVTISNYEYQMFYFSKTTSPNNSQWTSLNNSYAITGFYGSAKMIPAKGKLFSSSDSMHWFHALRDKDVPLAYAYVNGSGYKKISGWQKRPIYDQNFKNFSGTETRSDLYINKHQPTGRLFAPQWISDIGNPVGGYSGVHNNTVWSMTRSGQNTMNWSSDRLRIHSYGTSPTSDGLLFEYLDPSTFNRWYGLSARQRNLSLPAGITDYGSGAYRVTDESPDRNWCFIPVGYEGEEYNNNPHGSCVVYEAKFESSSISDDYAVVGMSSYYYASEADAKRINCVIRHSDNQVVVYDNISNASLGTITPNVSDYGSTPFSDDYWEFRWAWYPYQDETRCILMCRKFGEEEWLATSVLSPDTSAFSGSVPANEQTYNQMLYFGHKKSSPDMKSYWKSMAVHPNNDLGTFAYEQANWTPVQDINSLDAIRGRIISDSINTFDTSIPIKAVWGGASGVYNDRFFANMRYEYPATNVTKYQSPRIQYKTEKLSDNQTATNAEIVFKASGDEYFYHDSIALINCNVAGASVYYSTNGSTYIEAGAVDFSKNKGVSTPTLPNITSITNNIVTVSNTGNLMNSEISSNDKNKYYMRIIEPSNPSYADQCFEVTKSFGANTFILNPNNKNFPTINPLIVGSTVEFYVDKGYASYTTPMIGKYLKIVLNDIHNTAELQGRIGSIVAGMKLDFDTPLDWQFTDKEVANQQQFKSRSGIRWSYNQGTPERELSFKMIGDVSHQNRRTLRDQIKSINGYGEHNLVFVTESTGNDADQIFHGQYQPTTELSNQGWYYDGENQIWRPVGDMSITLMEIT
jgi:hypothetical protein